MTFLHAVNGTPRGLPPLSETLPQAIESLVRQIQPEKIILFGSYAYGTPTPDSDVDLLVVVRAKEGESYTERYLRVASALTPRLFPLDLIVKTPEEIEAAQQQFFPFLREILTKGICLYERR